MTGPITKQDKDMAAEYIYLTLLIKNLESDIELFKKTPVKLTEPYLHLLDSTISKVIKDLSTLKKHLKENEIKVTTNEIINEDFLLFEYFVRGYRSEFYFFNAALRNHINQRANRYFFQKEN